MKLKKLITLVLATIMLMGAGCSNAPQNNIVKAKRYIGQARGFWLAPDDWQAGGEAGLDAAVALATQQKLNTIFFELPTSQSGELDPLAYLCERAASNKVQVFALMPVVTDPTEDKAIRKLASDAAAVAKEYEISGLVLSSFEKVSQQDKVALAVSTAVQRASATTVFGLGFDTTGASGGATATAVEQIAGAGTAQIVLANMPTTMEGYLPMLETLTKLSLGTADLYTVNHCDNRTELPYQLLANALGGKVSGSVFAPYSVISSNTAKENEMLVSLLAPAKSSYTPSDLAIEQSLAVSYPTSGASVTDKEIWIMGTSDPEQTLMLGEEPVKRFGSQGTFGVSVPLAEGDNSFTFAQGDTKATVNVKRVSGTATAQPITTITAGSLFPTGSFGVDSNETFEVTVVGPATASITATLNGETVVMTQATTAKTKGVPATFKASFTMNPASFPADKVTSIGSVTYVVGYDGNHEVQKSQGDVYVAGKDVPLVVEVNEGRYVASVLTDVASEDNFTQTLKSGARARVVAKTRTTRSGDPAIAYKLSSGGYVMASNVTIVTDNGKLGSDITAITKESGDDWEQYTLTGGQPAALADWQAGKLVLRLLDTKLTADPTALAGGLITTVTSTATKDGVELALEYPAGSLWGYDITYADNTTKLYLRKTPKPSESYAKPLEGIRVMLDPGHGGTDPGAMGVAGELGPTEAELNMAFANIARFRLEQLGAEVLLTRADESVRVSLDERTYLAEREKPHIFIALHHNSTVLNKDLSGVKRMEAYYWEQIAAPLAGHLMTQLGDTLGRDTRDPENAYYYVTRLTFAPAVLFELGYVVNPAQYEDCTSFTSLCRAADGIGQAVVAAMAPQPAPPPVDEPSSTSAS